MPSLTVSLHRLEDLIDPSVMADHDVEAAAMDDATFAWFEEMVEQMNKHPDLRDLQLNPDIEEGQASQVKLIICSQEALENIFELPPQALGCHNLSVPDCDPFNEEAAISREQRILISWDPEAIRARVLDVKIDEPEIGAMAWLATFTHELHHVRLFAENAAMNAPSDIDLMMDDIGHDIFDISSGYGMRSLRVEGEDLWADSIEDAADLMEEYVEERGRIMADSLFTGHLSPEVFLEVSGLLRDQDPLPQP